jgi:hypothetical protein
MAGGISGTGESMRRPIRFSNRRRLDRVCRHSPRKTERMISTRFALMAAPNMVVTGASSPVDTPLRFPLRRSTCRTIPIRSSIPLHRVGRGEGIEENRGDAPRHVLRLRLEPRTVDVRRRCSANPVLPAVRLAQLTGMEIRGPRAIHHHDSCRVSSRLGPRMPQDQRFDIRRPP